MRPLGEGAGCGGTGLPPEAAPLSLACWGPARKGDPREARSFRFSGEGETQIY